MRVLHVTPDLSPKLGGTTTHTVELCRAQARLGAAVTVMTTDLDEIGKWTLGYRAARLADESGVVDGVVFRYFPINWPSRFGFSRKLARHLGQSIGHYDLIHVHRLYRFPTLVAGWNARRAAIPYVVSPHGGLLPYHRRRRRLRKQVYNLIERNNLDHAGAICYTSQYELDQAESLRLAPPTAIIPCGINPQDFVDRAPAGAFRKKHPELGGKRLVVFLGRLAPQKGIDLLVEAFYLVAKRVSNAHLVIAGPDEEGHLDSVTAWLHNRGLSQLATITGPLYGKDKLQLLRDADVWVLPSYAENFGIGVLEALASRLPVVISDRVGIHSDVSASQAGLVVPCDAGEVADAITAILEDNYLASRLGEAGWRLATGRFTWDAAAAQMISLYETLVDGQGERRYGTPSLND